MKPIEAGCLAMLINLKTNDHLNGTTVKVLRFSEAATEVTGQPNWKVKGSFCATAVVGMTLFGEGVVAEKNLVRIDGDDFSDEDKPYAVKEKGLSYV